MAGSIEQEVLYQAEDGWREQRGFIKRLNSSLQATD